MKISSLALPIFLFTFITLISCKKNNNDTGQGSCINETNWIKDGHQLVYVNQSAYIPADSLFINLHQISTGVFKSTSQYDDGSIYPVISVYLQACGNSIYQSTTENMSDKQEIYRIDGNTGDSWSADVTSLGGVAVKNTITITGKDVSVTVPAGTYKCLKLHMVSSYQGQSIESDMYLNKTYGPVKVEGNTSYSLARTNFQ